MGGETGKDRNARAIAGRKLDHRAVLADEKIAGTGEPRRGHLQRSEQHAQRVEMMDQNFRDQHAPFAAHEGLPLQRRAESVRSRQYARRQQRELRLLDVADASLAQPCRSIPVIAAKAPVLMHHQACRTFDLGGEVGRLLQIGRERLLAKHRQALLGGEAHQRRVHLAGRCDIDGVESPSREHRLGAGIGLRDPELGRAPRGVFGGGIGDRHDAGLIWYSRPGDQMVAAHHAGADQANAQRLVHGRAFPVMAGNQHALALLSIMLLLHAAK